MNLIAQDPVHWLSLVPLKLAQTFDHESFAIEYLHEAAPERWPEPRRQAGRRLLSFFHWLLMSAAALSVVAWVPRTSPRRAWMTQRVLLLLVLGYVIWCFTRTSPPFYVLAVLTPLLALVPLPGHPGWLPQGRETSFIGPGPAGYLLGLLAMTTLTHAVFFGDDRYHLVVTPALCILAAAAVRRDRNTSRPTAQTSP